MIKKITPALLSILFSLSLVTVNPAYGVTLPPGFSRVLVSKGIVKPTVMVFAPDGRLFVAQQTGQLRIIKNGTLLARPFITLSVNSSGERGLLGIAFDPAFTTNHYIYLYHTLSSAANNRISRYTASADTVVPGSEVVVLNLDPLSSATNHNGGTIAFGPDGKLYVGVGENANGPNAQDTTTTLGKILRINSDGTVPAGNPFPIGNAAKQRIWEYGMRNPYTLTFQPGTGRLFVNDVGQNTWEEINDCTTGGHNYGWPNAEGSSTNSAYTNPVYAYQHGSGPSLGCAITGGTFFNPTATNYPSAYTGSYFYIDFCGDWIDMLTLSGTTVTHAVFGSNIGGSPVSIVTGPEGNLYFISRDDSAVYKILYAAPYVLAPVADAQVHNKADVNKNFGSNPALTVRKSSDANGTYLSYLRFDISSLPVNSASVKLRLYGQVNNNRTKQIITQVFNVTSQTWGESTITFANKPAAETTVLASKTIAGTALKYYEFDVTAHINSLRSAGATSVSFMLATSTTTNSSRVVFNSKEAASNPPQLVATQSSARMSSADESDRIPVTVASLSLPVYPNPAGERLHVGPVQGLAGKTLRVIDINGRLIQEDVLTGEPEQAISTAGLQEGIYFLILDAGDNIYTQRVVIKK